MPELAPPVAPPASSPPPPSQSGGSDDFAASLESVVNGSPESGGSPPPKETPPAPEVKTPEAKQVEAPAPKVEPAKAAPVVAKPTPVVQKPSDKDPVQLRQRLAQVETEKKGFEEKVRSYEAKLAELEKRPFLTPEQQTQQQQIQQRLTQTEQALYGLDYQQSPEFKTKYQTPYANSVKEAIADVRKLKVNTGQKDAEEKPVFRDATQGDWEKILNSDRVGAAQMARQLFGEDASIVLEHRSEVKRIETEANAAIQNRKTSFESERQKAQAEFQKSSTEFNSKAGFYEEALADKYKDHFGIVENDPESNAAYQRGLKFVELATDPKATVEERAKNAAVIKSWAAAYPRMNHLLKQRDSRITELESEIAKIRGTDPGNAGDGGGGAPATKSEGLSSEELANKTDWGKMPG